MFDESAKEFDGAASDASQMGASWHQGCLALECSLPPLPLLYTSSSSLSSSLPPPPPVRGETRTADVCTTQHVYSRAAHV